MRKKLNFNKQWKMINGEENSKFEDVIDKVIEGEEVILPHCNIIPINNSGGRNIQCVSWYQKQFQRPKLNANEKIIFEFEGVMLESEYYLNGKLVYSHDCGYTPAVFEVCAEELQEVNTIVVRVSNIDNNQIPPGKNQSGLDFNYDGGIYRDVNVIIQPRIHVTHPLLANVVAGGGVYVATLDVDEKEASLRIYEHIINEQSISQQITIKSEIYKGDQLITSILNEVQLNGKENYENINQLKISNPKLWDINNPQLYILKTSIICEDEIIDSVNTSFGIRVISVTKEDGFKINGISRKVSGSNYHQTFTQIGNAMTKNLIKRDVRKLREAGFIHIRTHYPISKYFVVESDNKGMMLTMSNPGWQFFQEGIFESRALQNMRNIIRWFRNHPSIIIWEGHLNESVMTDSFMEKMQNLIHSELPYGSCYSGGHSPKNDIVYANIDPDMIKGDFVVENQIVDKPLWVREYGDSPDNWTDQNTVWRAPRKWGEHIMIKQVERLLNTDYEWMSSYLKMYNSKSVSGFGLWPSIEYNRGYHLNPCYAGVLDLQRIEKYCYYFMKSQRDIDDVAFGIPSGPFVYIANSAMELAPTDITIFSNCDFIQLYYNDNLVAEQTPDDVAVKHPPFTFDGKFKIKRGRYSLCAKGYIDGKLVAEDRVNSHGVAKQLNIQLDDMGLGLEAGGSDVIFARVEALDREGNRVIYGCDEYPVKLQVRGNGNLVGDNIKYLELGVSGFLIKSTEKQGDIELEAMLNIEQNDRNIACENGYLRFSTYKSETKYY